SRLNGSEPWTYGRLAPPLSRMNLARSPRAKRRERACTVNPSVRRSGPVRPIKVSVCLAEPHGCAGPISCRGAGMYFFLPRDGLFLLKRSHGAIATSKGESTMKTWTSVLAAGAILAFAAPAGNAALRDNLDQGVSTGHSIASTTGKHVTNV